MLESSKINKNNNNYPKVTKEARNMSLTLSKIADKATLASDLLAKNLMTTEFSIVASHQMV